MSPPAFRPNLTTPFNSVSIKICLLGNPFVGKTSFMVKFINDEFDPTYRKTMGVNYMDKSLNLGQTNIQFSIYDLGGDRQYENMLPLATSGSVAICYTFDLTDPLSLEDVEKWWKLSKIANQNQTNDVVAVLIGTKYDFFSTMPIEHQRHMHFRSLQFAKALGSPVIYTSSKGSVNIQKIFKVVLGMAFELSMDLPEQTAVGEPLLIFKSQSIVSALLEKNVTR